MPARPAQARRAGDGGGGGDGDWRRLHAVPVQRRSSPLGVRAVRSDLLTAMEPVAGRMWDGVAVDPVMSMGAADPMLLRTAGIPMQGVSGLCLEPRDRRAHGRDDRVPMRWQCRSREFMLARPKVIAR